MPTCRYCRGVFPQDQFIRGNGPRYLVCVRCAVEQGFVTPDEVPQLYSDEVARARTSLFARRYGIWATLIVAWSAWFTMGQGITFWTPAILVALILISILAPIRHILGAARFKAELRRLTP